MAQELNYSLINNILIIKNLNSPLTDELINVIKKHKSIKFVGENFNFTLDNLPEGLESIKLNYGFNKPINNLPKSLKNLECGELFNQPIDNLPEGLESLKLNYGFNKPINNLPKSLKNLECGELFNQPINNLPKSLKNLECGVSFNQPIDNLPENLESLSFLNGDFNQEINLLPIGLKKLRINTEIFEKTLDYLPQNLEELELNNKIMHIQSIEKFPSGLKKLEILTKENNLDLLRKWKKQTEDRNCIFVYKFIENFFYLSEFNIFYDYYKKYYLDTIRFEKQNDKIKYLLITNKKKFIIEGYSREEIYFTALFNKDTELFILNEIYSNQKYDNLLKNPLLIIKQLKNNKQIFLNYASKIYNLNGAITITSNL